MIRKVTLCNQDTMSGSWPGSWPVSRSGSGFWSWSISMSWSGSWPVSRPGSRSRFRSGSWSGSRLGSQSWSDIYLPTGVTYDED